MSPRTKVNKSIPILLLLLISVALCTSAAERPNILFIFADDWGWGDLSCHGHPYVKTPNIDRLARGGTFASTELHERDQKTGRTHPADGKATKPKAKAKK